MRAWFAGVVLSVLGLGAFCATAQASSVADTGRRIEQARNANDSATLVRVRDTLAQATKRDAHAGKYAYYYLGYADYALGDFYMGSDTHKATAYLHDGEAALQQALQRDPDFAEALALLASSYGEELALDPTKGMFLGPRENEALARALRLAPDNPRVAMFKAAADYYTPVAFGGDKQRGEQGMRKAIALFEHDRPADADAPRWGRAEAHFLLGQMEAAAGRTQQARVEYQTALAVEPVYVDAKAALDKLPGASR